MRLVFLGSPPFAVPVLARVLASRHTVAGLVTRPDRPQGRGRKIEDSELVVLARERGIALLQPETTRDPAFVAALRALEPDVLLVASYGEILRREVLELCSLGALNVHASLLPRHRGASPIQAAILAGDMETGVSVQRMVLALDEGDVLVEERTPIGTHENAGELLDRLAVLGGEAAVRALDLLARGAATATPQDPARATYAKKIKKEHGRIDWSAPAVELDRFVRAMTPWPGARAATEDGREIVLLDAVGASSTPAIPVESLDSAVGSTVARSVEPLGPGIGNTADEPQLEVGRPLAPGTIFVVERALFVATGRGFLELRMLKPAGKPAMSAEAWFCGARLAPGARFS